MNVLENCGVIHRLINSCW